MPVKDFRFKQDLRVCHYCERSEAATKPKVLALLKERQRLKAISRSKAA